jgi:3-hydroxyacyl-[acyl-carrier-protein] dehydratase
VPVPETPFGREAIEAIIPHRDPFLLVDEIVELVPGERVRGRYTVRGDEDFLRGHFPGRPIMPGVLMVESLAQAGCVGVLAHPDYADRLVVFAGIESVRFRRIVEPGDTLELELIVERLRSRLGKGSGTVKVGDELAVEASLSFGFVDP